jgi:hypothetical protein
MDVGLWLSQELFVVVVKNLEILTSKWDEGQRMLSDYGV